MAKKNRGVPKKYTEQDFQEAITGLKLEMTAAKIRFDGFKIVGETKEALDSALASFKEGNINGATEKVADVIAGIIARQRYFFRNSLEKRFGPERARIEQETGGLPKDLRRRIEKSMETIRVHIDSHPQGRFDLDRAADLYTDMLQILREVEGEFYSRQNKKTNEEVAIKRAKEVARAEEARLRQKEHDQAAQKKRTAMAEALAEEFAELISA